ncbi:conserverd hypothetical protein [Pseudomonas gessardii]|uniref:DUF2388 domain-containing protein n=1 Tax=Pseudomonas gessardii TaxID=78544 RepID=A0A7Y1MKJ5_9PSED|nr:DUF2388 domain-containing protein [Pseudomonas gessardii]MRU49479.1 DUF2388 domain-containing protein [Pseudomonas gessardii]NNA93868.1 DUF2388 domain-containing protein [Pseudomonas gessardii]ONH47685.1 Holliday junction resolvase [Pseudomonas gessardii]SDR40070.1 conserverd hypothetical protein [Pseudomonas gessardii]
MDFWHPLAITLLLVAGTQAVAAENNNPFQAALMLTSVAPFVITSGATAGTLYIPELFKSSKSDALSFIGSDSEIRGAQFEQACRYYRSAYKPALMSDAQLALAIAAAG